MPASSYLGEYGGQRFEVCVDDLWHEHAKVRDHRVRFRVDGREVDAVRPNGRDTVLRALGFEARVVVSIWGSKVKRADLVLPDGHRMPLTEVPPPADAEDGSGSVPVIEWWRRVHPAQLWCVAGFAVMVLYGFGTRLLWPSLLSAPLAWAAVTGSTPAVVTLGASTAAGRVDLWWLGLAAATLSVVKFDLLWWWAGRLWKDRLPAVMGGRPSRPTRTSDRMRTWIARWRGPAIVATYLVPLIPTAVVLASAGASGMRMRNFLLVDTAAALATRCLYFYLGYRFGRPVLDVIDRLTSYPLWVPVGVAVGAVLLGSLRERRRARGAGPSVPVG